MKFSTPMQTPENLNVWQQVSQATHSVVTPANALDAVGFAGSMYGLQRLDSWKGITATCLSFMTDAVDGSIARATGTQSPLGEVIDAGGDKIKLAFAIGKIWTHELAPKPLVAAIAIQNSLNVALTTVDRQINHPPCLHPSPLGKKAIFMEQWGLGLHVIGSELTKNHERPGKILKITGTILGLSGVALGMGATTGYALKVANGRLGR